MVTQLHINLIIINMYRLNSFIHFIIHAHITIKSTKTVTLTDSTMKNVCLLFTTHRNEFTLLIITAIITIKDLIRYDKFAVLMISHYESAL